MSAREALRMLETRCRYFATDNLEIEETYEARGIIEKQLELLENLLQSKYVQAGFYIELDKPCIMILNEEGKVLDWIDIDFEMLQEVKNV